MYRFYPSRITLVGIHMVEADYVRDKSNNFGQRLNGTGMNGVQ